MSLSDPELITEGIYDTGILKAVFIAGAGGSGKTKVAREMFGGSAFKFIDADRHLERFLKLADVPLSQAGTRYDLFLKARDLRNVELENYAKRRLGLVIDSTGWAYGRVAEPVQRLRALGYDCYMVVVATSLETALKRNKERGEAGGRSVPDNYVRDAWEGLNYNIRNYRALFGKKFFFEINNDAARSDAEWSSDVAPQLTKLASKLTGKPLSNPVGVAWLRREKKNPTLDTPDPEMVKDKKRAKVAAAQMARGAVPPSLLGRIVTPLANLFIRSKKK